MTTIRPLAKLSTAALLGGLLLGQAIPADANTVGFEPETTSVLLGETFTLDVVGRGFSESTDGGGINLSLDPTVLQIDAFSLSASWDVFSNEGTIDNASGTLTGADFATFSDPPTNFTIGTLTLTAVGLGTSELMLSESFGIGGFGRGGSPQSVTFEEGQISVVPLPAAAWLLLGALATVGAFGQRRPGPRKA